MSVSSALRRLLVPLLRDVRDGKPMKFRHRSAAEQSLFLVQRKPSPSRKKPAQARKEAKRALHREETGAIREAVFGRAGGYCEAFLPTPGGWKRCPDRPSDMDHWLGGIGRRREKQSVETCWALCRDCHGDRTAHWPSVFCWNQSFALHCEKHGYPVLRHIEHASLRPAPAAPPPPPSGGRSGAGQEET